MMFPGFIWDLSPALYSLREDMMIDKIQYAEKLEGSEVTVKWELYYILLPSSYARCMSLSYSGFKLKKKIILQLFVFLRKTRLMI